MKLVGFIIVMSVVISFNFAIVGYRTVRARKC